MVAKLTRGGMRRRIEDAAGVARQRIPGGHLGVTTSPRPRSQRSGVPPYRPGAEVLAVGAAAGGAAREIETLMVRCYTYR